jgi:hypothetical protein
MQSDDGASYRSIARTFAQKMTDLMLTNSAKGFKGQMIGLSTL